MYGISAVGVLIGTSHFPKIWQVLFFMANEARWKRMIMFVRQHYQNKPNLKSFVKLSAEDQLCCLYF